MKIAHSLRILALSATLALTAGIAQATPVLDHPENNSVYVDGNQDVSVIMYDCGKGFLQSDPCRNIDRKITESSSTKTIMDCSSKLLLSGYEKTYRCSNGWQVTHPDFCPDSGKNNLQLSRSVESIKPKAGRNCDRKCRWIRKLLSEQKQA